MTYRIEGDFSPVLTVTLNRNDLITTKPNSEVWHTPGIVEIKMFDTLSEALSKKYSEDILFHRKYTANEDNSEITLIPDRSPCTILPIETDGECPILLKYCTYFAATSDVKMRTYYTKMDKRNRFELRSIEGKGILFAQFPGNIIRRRLSENEALIVRNEQLAGCTTDSKLDIISDDSGLSVKVTGGEAFLYTALQNNTEMRYYTETTNTPKE